MTIGSGSKSSVAYVLEGVDGANYGVTPATPVFQKICNTGCTLALSKDAIESGCLNDSRQVTDLRHGNRSAGGNIDSELEYGSYDDMLEAVFMGTWTADVLKVGATRRSFTIERYFDLSVDEWHRYIGSEVNTMSISTAPNQMVTTSFGIVSKDLDNQNVTSMVSGATYSDETGNPPFDSFNAVMTEGGVVQAVLSQIDMSIENGIAPKFVIGSKTTIQPSDGKSRVTGTATAYFASSELLQKFWGESESSLEIEWTDLDGNVLKIEIPKLKYTSGTNDTTGPDDITVPLAFTAIYDDVEQSQIIATRTPV